MQSKNLLLLTCIFFIYFSNLFGLLLYSFTSYDFPASYMKYCVVLLPFFGLMFGGVGLDGLSFLSNRWFIYCIIIFSLFFTSFDPNYFNLFHFIQNIQVFLVLPLCFFLGIFLGSLFGRGADIIIFKKFLAMTLFFVLIGIVEIFFGYQFWNLFNLEKYFRVAMGFQNSIASPVPLPRGWVSWDLSGFASEGYIIRMATLLLDPIGFGRLSASLVIISTVYYRFNDRHLPLFSDWYKFLSLILLLVGIIFTYSKGAYLLIIVWVLFYYFGMIFLLLTGACIGIIIFLAGTSIFEIMPSSVIAHFSNLSTGWISLITRPLGYGIGANDVLIASMIEQSIGRAEMLKSEGGFAIYTIAFGWPGVFAYLYLFYCCWPRHSKADLILYYTSALGLSCLATSVFAHSAFSLVGSGFIFIMMGCRQYLIRHSPHSEPFGVKSA